MSLKKDELKVVDSNEKTIKKQQYEEEAKISDETSKQKDIDVNPLDSSVSLKTQKEAVNGKSPTPVKSLFDFKDNEQFKN